MTYVRPLRISAQTPELEIDESKLPLSLWDKPSRWFITRFAEENDYNVIDGVKLVNKIGSEINSIFGELQSIDSDFSDKIIEDTSKQLRAILLDHRVVIFNDFCMILPMEKSNCAFLISKSKEDAEKVIKSMADFAFELEKKGGDFGVEIEVIYGGDLAHILSKALEADIERRDEFDNEFEEIVYSDINSTLGDCLETNIVLKFGDEDPEVFEYDIIFYLNINSRIVIEVKDASHENADLGKPDLIDRPKDKTEIIEGMDFDTGIADKTECVVIIKGMTDGKFEQHQIKAERRDIYLLQFDERGNYLNEIKKIVRQLVLEDTEFGV